MRIVTISDSFPKRIILFCFLFLTAGITKAQDVPASPILETPADYKQYEPNVVANIRWITQNPRDKETDNRRSVEDFLVKWIYGCPYVKVIIEPYAMKLSSRNADLLLSFMFGYTLYKLDHPQDKNLLNANVAGINMLLDDYKLNTKLLKEDPAIGELLKMQSTESLSEWIRPKLGQLN